MVVMAVVVVIAIMVMTIMGMAIIAMTVPIMQRGGSTAVCWILTIAYSKYGKVGIFLTRGRENCNFLVDEIRES